MKKREGMEELKTSIPSVAPLVGAWIEIYANGLDALFIARRSPRGSED